MMELAKERVLVELFRQNAAAKRREERFLEDNERLIEAREEREADDKRDREFLDRMDATSKEIEAFGDRLDRYDTAVVEALMENEQALEENGQRRKEIETAAYRLPDGRMAFKTEDGQRVFDEKGAALSRDTVSPDEIADTRPRWETFQAGKAEHERLMQDRQDLHRYQDRLDQAREASHKDGITALNLDALGADLERDMPQAVKAKLGGASLTTDEPQLSASPGSRPATQPIQRLGL